MDSEPQFQTETAVASQRERLAELASLRFQVKCGQVSEAAFGDRPVWEFAV